MAVKPTQVPEWDSGGANTVEPTTQKTSGWAFGGLMVSSFANWFYNRTYLWLDWLNDVVTTPDANSLDIQNGTSSTLSLGATASVDTTFSTSGNALNTGGGSVNTGSGNVNTTGGDVNLSTGNVMTGGGDVDIGGGSLVSAGVGDVDLASGAIVTASGNIEATAGTVTAGNYFVTDEPTQALTAGSKTQYISMNNWLMVNNSAEQADFALNTRIGGGRVLFEIDTTAMSTAPSSIDLFAVHLPVAQDSGSTSYNAEIYIHTFTATGTGTATLDYELRSMTMDATSQTQEATGSTNEAPAAGWAGVSASLTPITGRGTWFFVTLNNLDSGAGDNVTVEISPFVRFTTAGNTYNLDAVYEVL